MPLNSKIKYLIFMLIIFVVLALAPFFAPHSPFAIHENSLRLRPFVNLQFILGTDDLGRDIFSRLLHGGRISLFIGFSVATISIIVGTILGLISAYFEGPIDLIISRSTDILQSIPNILLAIVIMAIFGPSTVNSILAISLVSLPNIVRQIRSLVFIEKHNNYVIAARLCGASHFHIIFKEILPNLSHTIIIHFSLGLSQGILGIAGLGFLGLGLESPTAEWGAMLSDSRNFLEQAPWMAFFPGLCIFFLIFIFNFIGDRLQNEHS